ncbi:hypothetical protein [Acidiferrobacter sp.]|uniref:hypothetical protein n=1 Tax=Acidiferrobacter sp. TaxID=1872107 RepID=UPI00260F03D7|nr:hypothetical protein [Acidiferrobacter sp.]
MHAGPLLVVADAPAVKPRVFALRPVFEAFVATKQGLLVARSCPADRSRHGQPPRSPQV